MQIESPQARKRANQSFEPIDSDCSGRSTLPSVFGRVDWLDESGTIRHFWRIDSESITIGSGSGCSIVLSDLGLESVHVAVTFGKNHILVQAIDGPVRVAGRHVREWLIDEPTVVLMGTAKLRIIPASFDQNYLYAAHRVTPGNISEQTARLQTPSHAEVSQVEEIVFAPVVQPDSNVANANLANANLANEIKLAVDPLRDSLDSIRNSVVDGLRELSNSLVDRYEQRFRDTSAVIDSRFERLETLLASSNQEPRYPAAGENDPASNVQWDAPAGKDVYFNSPSVEDQLDGQQDSELYSELYSEPPPEQYPEQAGSLENSIASTWDSSPINTPTNYDQPENEYVDTPHAENPYAENPYAENAYSENQSNPELETEVDYSLPYSDDQPYHGSRFVADAYASPEDHQVDHQEAEVTYELPATNSDLPAWFTAKVEDSRENEESLNESGTFDSKESIEAPEDFNSSRGSAEDKAESAFDYRQDEANVGIGESDLDRMSEPIHSIDNYRSDNDLEQTNDYEQSDEVEEESIEVYMQRLLKRMKGELGDDARDNLTSGAKSTSRSQPPPQTSEPKTSYTTEPKSTKSENSAVLAKDASGVSEASNNIVHPPAYVRTQPRISVEEQQQSMIALRELANHTARKAISQNTKKRTVGLFAGKLMISGGGFLGGTILMIMNGLTPNVVMAGMLCSYAVFLVWGYDAWYHSRRLLAAKNEEEVEDE